VHPVFPHGVRVPPSTPASLQPSTRNLQPGDHVCAIFQGDEERRAVVGPFLQDGLVAGDKVVYVVDQRPPGSALEELRALGMDPTEPLRSGQLVLQSAMDAYTRDGRFDPDLMIQGLADLTAQARAEGYRALRITGEMSWATRGVPGSDRIMEYEMKLNRFFPGSDALGLCQYDRRHFGPRALLDVLTAHPVAAVGTEVYDNFYFIPPEELLDERPEAELEQRIANLREARRNEEARAREAATRMQLERLREVDRARAEFVNLVAHEFNTPLTPMRLQVGFLRAQPGLTAEQQRSLTLLDRNVDRLASLVQDVLDAARVQSARLSLQPVPLDLPALVHRGVEAHRPAAKQRGIDLLVDAAPGPAIPGDPRRIGQVLDNLLANAVRHAAREVQVRVAAAPGGGAEVEVRDDGTGFEPGQEPLLFRPFSQLERPEQSTGTGLGLYVSKGIVEAHGGSIAASSSGPGKGAVFRFHLPPQGPAAARPPGTPMPS
jgi:signal transduction histidine kinase